MMQISRQNQPYPTLPCIIFQRIHVYYQKELSRCAADLVDDSILRLSNPLYPSRFNLLDIMLHSDSLLSFTYKMFHSDYLDVIMEIHIQEHVNI